MSRNDPFRIEKMNDIFKLSDRYLNRIISRENTWLEFKEAFSWQSISEYARTCAAFANTRGGYIVFGVTDNPRTLKGLSSSGKDKFLNMDTAKMSSRLNEYFAPEIKWDISTHEIQDKLFGILYAHEAIEKPIICIRSASSVEEGDILYRYSGRTSRVKYAELKNMIEEKRQNEQRLWMKLIAKISKIGVRDAAIFNLNSGTVTGAAGSFVIDESLLSHLSFIKEGEFREIKGKPTLRLIGNVEPVGGAPQFATENKIVRTRGIRTGDIVLDFLLQKDIVNPLDYISQICFENSAFLPLYYYIYLANISIKQTLELINKVGSRSQARTKLISRLVTGRKEKTELPSSRSKTGPAKLEYLRLLKNEGVEYSIDVQEIPLCLQAVRALESIDINEHFQYLRSLMRDWFDKYYFNADHTIAAALRNAICWIDEAAYMGRVKTNG